MGEPIRVSIETIHDEFTFSPFTADDVDEDGDVRGDVAVLFPHYNPAALHSGPSRRAVTLHAIRFPVALEGSQYTRNGQPLVKGVTARPVTLRKTCVASVEPGMLLVGYPRCNKGFAVVVGIESAPGSQLTMRVRYRVYADVADKEPFQTDEYRTAEVFVLVEDDEPRVLK